MHAPLILSIAQPAACCTYVLSPLTITCMRTAHTPSRTQVQQAAATSSTQKKSFFSRAPSNKAPTAAQAAVAVPAVSAFAAAGAAGGSDLAMREAEVARREQQVAAREAAMGAGGGPVGGRRGPVSHINAA